MIENNFQFPSKDLLEINNLSNRIDQVSSIIYGKTYSLKDARSCEQELLKIQETAQAIFKNPLLSPEAKNLEERTQNTFLEMQKVEEEKIQSDLYLLESYHEVFKELDQIDIHFSILSFEEIESKLDRIEEKLENLNQKFTFNRKKFEKIRKDCKDKLQRLSFLAAFPIFLELDNTAYHSNFANMAKDDRQLQIIEEAKQMQKIAFLAYKRKTEKALYLLNQLSPEILHRINQHLFTSSQITTATLDETSIGKLPQATAIHLSELLFN